MQRFRSMLLYNKALYKCSVTYLLTKGSGCTWIVWNVLMYKSGPRQQRYGRLNYIVRIELVAELKYGERANETCK